MRFGRTEVVGVVLSSALLFGVGIASAEDEPIFGRSMMTMEERNEYRKEIRAAESEEERSRIRDRHRKEMTARAEERGVTLPHVAAPGPKRPDEPPRADAPVRRGRDLMSEEERARHRKEMGEAKNEQERERIRERKHEEMKERATERGETLPERPRQRGRATPPGSKPGAGRGGSR